MGRTFWIAEYDAQGANAKARRGEMIGALTRSRIDPTCPAFYWLLDPEQFRAAHLVYEGESGRRLINPQCDRTVAVDERGREYTAYELACIIFHPACYWSRRFVGQDTEERDLSALVPSRQSLDEYEPDTDANDGVKSSSGTWAWGRAWPAGPNDGTRFGGR